LLHPFHGLKLGKEKRGYKMREVLMDRVSSGMKRKEDCHAIGACSKVGNVRELCEKGGVFSTRDTDVCMVSLILLLDKLIEKSDKS